MKKETNEIPNRPKNDCLHICRNCGGYPAIKRFWNKKVLCNKCASPSFQKWFKTENTIKPNVNKK